MSGIIGGGGLGDVGIRYGYQRFDPAIMLITVAILVVLVASYIRGDSDTVAWGRKVMEENIRTAVVIFFFVLTTVFTATVLLISVTGSPLLDCTYEIISAVATVGLTRSLTPTLPFMGKVIVILVMFMGRIGPVTLAVALRRRTGRKDVDIQRPEQRILIG